MQGGHFQGRWRISYAYGQAGQHLERLVSGRTAHPPSVQQGEKWAGWQPAGWALAVSVYRSEGRPSPKPVAPRLAVRAWLWGTNMRLAAAAQSLYLDSNQVTGSIPKEVLTGLLKVSTYFHL